ncbi:MAG TPA: hypothetical protein VMU66_07955 [Gaiellales bacterium]|nr:hypothetical protein [Gaiellales bacterium]
MRRVLFLSLIAALAAGAPATASAAAPAPSELSIGVAPSKLQMRLVPGQTAHAVLRAYDKGSAPVVLDVFLQDYTISSNSSVVFRPAGSLVGSAAPWTQLSATVLHIPAHGERAVSLVIRVPRTAALGTHTLAVVFRSRVVSTAASGVRYRSAVASLMAAGVASADGAGLVMRGQAVLRSVSVSWPSLLSVRSPGDLWNALFHPTVAVQVGVENTGNTFFNVLRRSIVTFAPGGVSLGGSSAAVAAPSYTILPKSIRWIDAGWSNAPFVGTATVETRLYYNHTSALALTSPATVTIIPWNLLIVAGALLPALLSWAGARSIRRRRRSGGRQTVWAERRA